MTMAFASIVPLKLRHIARAPLGDDIRAGCQSRDTAGKTRLGPDRPLLVEFNAVKSVRQIRS